MTVYKTSGAVLYCQGRIPIGGDEISVRTGRPRIGSGFELLAEIRLTTITKGTAPAERNQPVPLQEKDLTSREIMEVLGALEMTAAQGFVVSLANGSACARDPNGDTCATIKRKNNGNLEVTTYPTPYTVARRNEKL